jgi:hypothetical protein
MRKQEKSKLGHGNHRELFDLEIKYRHLLIVIVITSMDGKGGRVRPSVFIHQPWA